MKIEKYWGHTFYNWFYNIDKALDFDKFFCSFGTIVRQYKRIQILVTIEAFNNITVNKLLIACHGVLSNSYYYKITNNVEKLLEQEDIRNTLKVATPIFLIIGMQIGLTKFLEVGPLNAEFDSKKRLCERCTGVD